MTDNARSFPEDLAWKVTYDPTIFVSATIDKVKHTLLEAVVLVLLVVYIFLGNIRATLIPMIAVPVSLIGTFIVLNAIGYSANTVSLLAMILAIGIVVDDAIVVVEAVEQTMEAHPELSPAEATKLAMGRDLRADHRHHAGTAGGVRSGRLHLGNFRRAVPAVRRHRRRVDVPVGDQRADAVAGSVRRAAQAASRPEARRDGHAEPVDRPDTRRLWIGRCAARRLLPSSVSSLWLRHLSALDCWPGRHPTGFIPSDDQGAFFVVVQLPDGASIGRTSDVVRQVEDILKQESAIADVNSIIGLELRRQLLAAQLRIPRRHAEEFRRTRRQERNGGRHYRKARHGASRGQRRQRHSAGAAANHRTRHRRWISAMCCRICAAANRQDMAQVLRGLVIAANQDPKLARVFTTFSATNPSVFLDIDRDKARILGIEINSIFQALQTSLGGFYVNDINLFGRTWQVQVQAESEDRSSVDDIYRINVRSNDGQDDPAAQPRRGAHRARSAGADPLQQYPGRDDPGRTCARRVVRTGARCDGCGGGENAALRISGLLDRHLVPGKAGGRPDARHPRFRAAVRLPVPGRPVRKLDDTGSGAVVGLGRRGRRVLRHRARRPDARSLCADRHDRADRAGGEERHPDRRIRQGAARARVAAAGGCDRRRAAALPAGDDDVVRLHPGPRAAGDRVRRVEARVSQRRHTGLRRHARGVADRHLRDPAAVRHVPGPSRADQIEIPSRDGFSCGGGRRGGAA